MSDEAIPAINKSRERGASFFSGLCFEGCAESSKSE